MPNEYLDKVELNNTTYDIKDTISGYISGITVDNGSATTNLVTSSSNPYNASTNALATMADIGAAGGGTVTSVGLSNASGESDFTITGSPVTSSGTITIEHSNSITAKTTEAVYPVKIDKHGHITSAGTAVTIPSVTSTYSSTGTDAVNGTAVNAALQTLDSSITATSNQAISAVTITDGKITASSKINVGDVMLYGNNCLVVFYKSFDTSYSYTKIGHINNLPDLGNENISIRIEK